MKSKMILHQFPRCPTIPSVSVFCLKLETFLRMAGYEYEHDGVNWKGPGGKSPWMTIGDEAIGDSQGIIDLLAKRHPDKANFDSDLTPQQKATAKAMRLMLEEKVYFLMGIERFDKINKKYMDGHFMKFVGVPGFMQGFVRGVAGGRIKKRVPDLGNLSREDRMKTGSECFQILSDYLGNNQYFLGDKVSSYDAIVFASCAEVIFAMPENCEWNVGMNGKWINLKNYTMRMKEKYWPDWNDCLLAKPLV